MGKYIIVNPKRHDIRISDHQVRRKTAVPCNRREMNKEIKLVGVVCGILYAKKQKEVARNRIQSQNTDDLYGCCIDGKRIAFSIRPPDPWLIVLALVMWEGIIQGLTWDVVKVSVRTVLRNLQDLRLAPLQDNFAAKINRKKITKSQLKFSWTSYTKGKKQYELFLGLKREYKSTMLSGK